MSPAITEKSIRSAIKSHKAIMKKLELGLITEDEICTRCLSRQKGKGLRFFCNQCFREVSHSSNNTGNFVYFGVERYGASYYEKYINSSQKNSHQKSLMKNSPPKNQYGKIRKNK